MLEAACQTVHPIECSEIWGGNHGDALDAETGVVRASLFSRACDGGKGGDIYYFSVCSSGELIFIDTLVPLCLKKELVSPSRTRRAEPDGETNRSKLTITLLRLENGKSGRLYY